MTFYSIDPPGNATLTLSTSFKTDGVNPNYTQSPCQRNIGNFDPNCNRTSTYDFSVIISCEEFTKVLKTIAIREVLVLQKRFRFETPVWEFTKILEANS